VSGFRHQSRATSISVALRFRIHNLVCKLLAKKGEDAMDTALITGLAAVMGSIDGGSATITTHGLAREHKANARWLLVRFGSGSS
jgi:hypothetical protein